MVTKSTKHEHTNIKPTILFATENFCLKKTSPSQIRTQDICRPTRICYLQTQSAGDTKKIEITMSQGTNRSPDEFSEKLFK